MSEAAQLSRLVAAQSALLALLIEQHTDAFETVDGLTATVSYRPETGQTLDVVYTSQGRPVAGEGL